MKEVISEIRTSELFRVRFPPITNADCFSGFIFSILTRRTLYGINLGKNKINFRNLQLYYLSKSDAEMLRIWPQRPSNLSA